MATTMQSLVDQARLTLLEASPRFWTDAELLGYANKAIKDLWKGTIDLYKDHIVTIDNTTMSIASGAGVVSAVPADLFRVVVFQPRVVGPNSVNPGLIFKYRELNSPDFVQARASRAIAPRWAVGYYAVINAGAPVGAPSIMIAPTFTSAVLLEVQYNPVIADKALGENNPIPGESDQAIIAYTIAWARAKEREDRSPDPEHIAIYATEKRNMLVALTPRSIQEPEVVESFMGDYGDPYGYDAER